MAWHKKTGNKYIIYKLQITYLRMYIDYYIFLSTRIYFHAKDIFQMKSRSPIQKCRRLSDYVRGMKGLECKVNKCMCEYICVCRPKRNWEANIFVGFHILFSLSRLLKIDFTIRKVMRLLFGCWCCWCCSCCIWCHLCCTVSCVLVASFCLLLCKRKQIRKRIRKQDE